MAATNNKLDEAILGLSRHDASLTTLSLWKNQAGDEGAGRLAEALITNTSLSSLYLSSNQVGTTGAGRLAEALPH